MGKETRFTKDLKTLISGVDKLVLDVKADVKKLLATAKKLRKEPPK